jgi:hypothetical protein
VASDLLSAETQDALDGIFAALIQKMERDDDAQTEA